MKKTITIIFTLLMLLTFLTGCTLEEVPIEIQKEIQGVYSNIGSYDAIVQNKLGGSKFEVDQEWELSIEKPDKYRKSVIKINDAPYEEHYEICNENTMYTLEEGKQSEMDYNCEGTVNTYLDMFSQLQYFTDKDKYESSAVYDGSSIRITISHIGSDGTVHIFVNPDNYLIKKVKYTTIQQDGSKTTREEVYKNIELNKQFDMDKFQPSSN
jgi:outer membrane lipoprotein-sorting protein